MQQKVNYILHLNKAFQKLNADQRLSPFHVSLYYSLFQYWNISKFKSPISISRDDQMQASKIGSVNTYLRCLKELDAWGYIKYVPSHNPMKGSSVYLFNFDNTGNTTNTITTNTTINNGNTNTTHTSSKTTPEKVVRPSINTINNLNKQTKTKGNESKSAANSDTDFDFSKAKSAGKKSSAGEKEQPGAAEKKERLRPKKKDPLPPADGQNTAAAAQGFARPLLPEVQQYFRQQKWPDIEAGKFFNHYESVGWLVGGKTPMQNWQASAGNWMINAEVFKGSKSVRPGNVHVNQDKDYSEPL